MAVSRADQPIAQGVEIRGVSGKWLSALDALIERRKKAEEAQHPESEIGDGQPDGARLQSLQHRPGETKDGVAGLAVGEQFVEHLADMRKRDEARVVERGRKRRQEHVAGVEAGEVAAGRLRPERANQGERLQRASE